MAYHRTEGVILRTTDYSESSQIAVVATPDLGQIHVLAKGSRRQRKDGRGPLDLLEYGDVVIAQRPAGQLHILTDWSLRENFPGIRRDLGRLWAGCYAAEVVLTTTSENADDGPVCGELLTVLRRLDRGESVDVALFQFLARALQILGNAPVTDRCVQCAGALQGVVRFSPAAGGAVCGDCAASDATAFGMSRGALAIMSRLAARDGGALALRITPDQAREIRRAFNELIQYHLGRSLRTARFLAGAV